MMPDINYKVLGVLAILAAVLGAGTFSMIEEGDRGISLANCHIDEEYNINDRCSLDYNNPDFENMGGNGWDVYVHKDGNTNFNVEVDYLRHLGEDFAPQLPYLANNGYLTESGQEDVNEDGDIGNVRMDNDIEWNSQVESSLESGTQCSVTIKPYSISEVRYKYNESGEIKEQWYHEDWGDEYRDFDNFFPDRVTLQAESVEFTENSMSCQFDFKEMMDKGAEHSNMVEFKAGRLEAGGDDSYEGYAKINVDFGLDDDGDDINNENDNCPQEAGVEERDGCPIPKETKWVLESGEDTPNPSCEQKEFKETQIPEDSFDSKSSCEEEYTLEEGTGTGGDDSDNSSKSLLERILDLLMFWK